MEEVVVGLRLAAAVEPNQVPECHPGGVAVEQRRQQPYTADNTEHKLHTHHMLRMDLRLRSIGHTGQHNQLQMWDYSHLVQMRLPDS